MSRIAYVNGRYLRLAEAAVSIEDRAFQFGDGVYEVCQVEGGALIEEGRHLERLERSLKALRIAAPVGEPALRRILREVVARNRVRDGLVYIQISRGVTRSRLLELAQRLGFSLQERPFSLKETFRAREAFFSSATAIAMPVVAIDGRAIGDGRPGSLTLALRRAFRDFASRA